MNNIKVIAKVEPKLIRYEIELIQYDNKAVINRNGIYVDNKDNIVYNIGYISFKDNDELANVVYKIQDYLAGKVEL
jgi:hypothetical protein